MIAREKLIAKLRELGYSFKKDSWRVSVFKRGTHRAEVRKRDFLEEQTVRQTLRQTKLMTAEEIDAFIACCLS